MYTKCFTSHSRDYPCLLYNAIKLLVMKEIIANVTVSVPYKRAGNVITQELVGFDLYKNDGHYTLVPCLNEDEARIANLPQELNFNIEDGEAVSLRGIRDGNLHVIQDAVKQLQENKQL